MNETLMGLVEAYRAYAEGEISRQQFVQQVTLTACNADDVAPAVANAAPTFRWAAVGVARFVEEPVFLDRNRTPRSGARAPLAEALPEFAG